MQVTTTSYTIAEYCQQMLEKNVTVNREYQRSSKVWPAAARSYLIDTILSGFPIPKLSLYQKTDLRTRRTIKEIVDGQQRSNAILDFFNDDLRITGKHRFSGSRFSNLQEEDQHRFLEYALSCDIFVGATDPEVRQVFQRMNSYQVLLNKQEQRHAIYQGEFKWFVVEMTERYAQLLKEIGVFSERDLIRMADAALITEIIYGTNRGIESASDPKLDSFYRDHEEALDHISNSGLLDALFSDLLRYPQLHNGPLMKSYQFYSLMLAFAHVNHGPIEVLSGLVPIEGEADVDGERSLYRLSELASALESPEREPQLLQFVNASTKGTNRITQRETRFKFMCAALMDSEYPHEADA